MIAELTVCGQRDGQFLVSSSFAAVTRQSDGTYVPYFTNVDNTLSQFLWQITMKLDNGDVLSTVTPVSDESMLFTWKAFH